MTAPDPTATLAALDFAPECVATGCAQPAVWRFVATHLDTWDLCVDEFECDHGCEIVWRFDTLEVPR